MTYQMQNQTPRAQRALPMLGDTVKFTIERSTMRGRVTGVAFGVRRLDITTEDSGTFLNVAEWEPVQ